MCQESAACCKETHLDFACKDGRGKNTTRKKSAIKGDSKHPTSRRVSAACCQATDGRKRRKRARSKKVVVITCGACAESSAQNKGTDSYNLLERGVSTRSPHTTAKGTRTRRRKLCDQLLTILCVRASHSQQHPPDRPKYARRFPRRSDLSVDFGELVTLVAGRF